jgi:hypothetical protein
MVVKVEQGKHGLYYATDPEVRGLFVAGRTETEARSRAKEGQRSIELDQDIVEDHHLHTHTSGLRVLVPLPEWQTEAQAHETVGYLTRFLHNQLT